MEKIIKIVNCENCKWHRDLSPEDGVSRYYDLLICTHGRLIFGTNDYNYNYVNPDDFCSFGEVQIDG